VLADSDFLIGRNIALGVAAIASAGAAVVAVRSSNKVAEAGERPVVVEEFSADAVTVSTETAGVGVPRTPAI
jgi:hypothetical protein